MSDDDNPYDAPAHPADSQSGKKFAVLRVLLMSLLGFQVAIVLLMRLYIVR